MTSASPYRAETDATPDLIGPGEIRDLLGIGKQRFHQVRHHRTFPPAAVVVQMGELWWRQDIVDWVAATADQRERGRAALRKGGQT